MVDLYLPQDMLFTILIGLPILLLTWLLHNHMQSIKKLPPGPWGLPFVGYSVFLGRKPHIKLTELRKKYGDVFSVNVGARTVVILSSYKAIKEALVKQADVFSLRPSSHNAKFVKSQEKMAEIWSETRRFSLTTLRDLGFGKTVLEPQIIDEIKHMLAVMKKDDGQPQAIHALLRLSVTNVISMVLTGHRFEYDDETFLKILDSISGLLKNVKPVSWRLIIPSFLGKFIDNLRVRLDYSATLAGLMSTIVDNHEKEYVSGRQNNFIDMWLTEMENKGDKVKEWHHRQNLKRLVFQLFIGGSDTTTNTLAWGLLYMIKFPRIQKKVQEEIDTIIGRDREPTMTDLKRMPYTEATLLELSRMTSILPLSVAHCTKRDTSLFDHFIPKGITVLPNLWAVHHDPDVFPEPYSFKPERFLVDQHQVKRMDELIPFSMGKLQCMGESLARMELFLYFTSLLQNFTFTKDPENKLEFDYDFSLILISKPQKICVKSR